MDDPRSRSQIPARGTLFVPSQLLMPLLLVLLLLSVGSADAGENNTTSPPAPDGTGFTPEGPSTSSSHQTTVIIVVIVLIIFVILLVAALFYCARRLNRRRAYANDAPREQGVDVEGGAPESDVFVGEDGVSLQPRPTNRGRHVTSDEYHNRYRRASLRNKRDQERMEAIQNSAGNNNNYYGGRRRSNGAPAAAAAISFSGADGGGAQFSVDASGKTRPVPSAGAFEEYEDIGDAQEEFIDQPIYIGSAAVTMANKQSSDQFGNNNHNNNTSQKTEASEDVPSSPDLSPHPTKNKYAPATGSRGGYGKKRQQQGLNDADEESSEIDDDDI